MVHYYQIDYIKLREKREGKKREGERRHIRAKHDGYNRLFGFFGYLCKKVVFE